ncbi:MAG: YicC/YloC family endoribonuclease [Myxococcota bacterium]
MTGFGQGTGEAHGRAFTAEVRTVNHKYLDVKVRLPFGLAALEGRVQGVVRRHLQRGRVEVSVGVAAGGGPLLRPRVDAQLAGAYVDALRGLAGTLGLPGQISVSDLLRLHDVLLVAEPALDLEQLGAGVERAVELALQSADRMRREEGAALRADLDARLATLDQMTDGLAARAPAAVTALQERLRTRVAELVRDTTVDPVRLAQECALLAERADVAEELTRLRSHVAHFRKLMGTAEPAGRKLDFLCQELNREANTLSSKSASAEMASLVVDLKAEIERIREQVQNVE